MFETFLKTKSIGWTIYDGEVVTVYLHIMHIIIKYLDR